MGSEYASKFRLFVTHSLAPIRQKLFGRRFDTLSRNDAVGIFLATQRLRGAKAAEEDGLRNPAKLSVSSRVSIFAPSVSSRLCVFQRDDWAVLNRSAFETWKKFVLSPRKARKDTKLEAVFGYLRAFR